jgi:hypothetical protein
MLTDQIAKQTGPSWHLDVSCSTRANLLMIGPADVTAMLLETVRPQLEEPVVTLRGGEPLGLPPGRPGTLIVNNLWLLTPAEQTELNEALGEKLSGTQVISTSATRLIPMLQEGRFLDTLYYRLNTVYVDVGDSPSSRVGDDIR